MRGGKVTPGAARAVAAAAALALALLALAVLGIWGLEVRGSAPMGAASHDSGSAYDFVCVQMAFGPRVPGSRGHADARTYLVERLSEYADSVEVQEFEFSDESSIAAGKAFTLANIIALFNPDAPYRILLGAHWDTRPVADRDPGDDARTPVPGANDGASGVGVLLSLAREFSADPPPVGVVMVLFDGEDYGPGIDQMFLGSRKFAEVVSRYRPDWGIVVDMVGDRNLNIYQELNSLDAAPEHVRYVWETARRLGCGGFIGRPRYRLLDDHVPLIEAGIPTVLLIDFDYPYWHTSADTLDKVSPESLEQVRKVLREIVYSGPPQF